MKQNINPDFTHKILEKIPVVIKPADYIADILHIGKDNAYRRLRGIIPFTFEEILILSKKLNLSIDELLKNNKSNQAIFNIQNGECEKKSDEFINMFAHFTDNQKKIFNSQENLTIISINRVISMLSYPFENLFKFSYYKWLYELGELSHDHSFSDFIMPDKLKALSAECLNHCSSMNIVFICDKNIIYNTVTEIKHFVDSGLIDSKNLRHIKDDLKALIEIIYDSSLYGILGSGAQYDVYYSSLNIENNMSYMTYDNHALSYTWIQPERYIYTTDPKLCDLQKNWLESLKKYSVLISQSNYKMQTNLYNKAIEQIENLF